MIKVYLEKITQHGNDCYIGKIDPRILVEIATKIEMSTVQDAQRPLNEKRVKDIANYVSDDNGILPSTLTIASKDSRIDIKECEEIPGIYYTYLPNKDSEYKDYRDSVDVMDGQHRLYSFLKDIRIISDSEVYEIGFTLYDKPTLLQRRKIFISCNEKQEKVSPNLLLWFKEKLNMLSNDEKRYYTIVTQLSNEFPLKNHIIMSAEKIKNGVKAKEIIADFQHVHILDLSSSGRSLTDDQIVKVIRIYLSSWQKVAGFDFSSSSPKDAGVAVKMAGLKYMLYILPTLWDYSISCHEKFSEAFVEKTLKKMIDKFGIEYSAFFTDKNLNKYFRDRTAISQLANESIDIIKKFGSEDFDPLA